RPHRGKGRLLNQVLCDVGLAYTLEGVAIENVTVFIDPARRIARHGRGQLWLDIWLANSTRSSPRLKWHAGELTECRRIVKKKLRVAVFSSVGLSHEGNSRGEDCFRGDLFSAKGAISCQPGASAPGVLKRALKA